MTPIQQVAKKANVSAATVSRVLNNNPHVSPKTREKVLAVIQELKFSPNLSGRILRRNETNILLVLLPTISNPFYAASVSGIRHEADKEGYLVMICNTEEEVGKERQFLDLLKYRQADGAILMAQFLSCPELEEYAASGPIIQCFEHIPDCPIPYVTIDDECAAYEMTNYLLGIGHRRIALVGCEHTYSSAQKRENGYLRAMREAGIAPRPEWIVHGRYGFRSGFSSAGAFFALEERPTAIFAISDMQATGVIKRVKSEGLRVPQDISVVGFDNISIASMADPAITTVAQPARKIGACATRMLLEQLKDKESKPKNVVMAHELVIRDSTCARTESGRPG